MLISFVMLLLFKSFQAHFPENVHETPIDRCGSLWWIQEERQAQPYRDQVDEVAD